MKRRNNLLGSGARGSSEVSESIDVSFGEEDEISVVEGEPMLGNSIATFSFTPEAEAAAKAKPENPKFEFTKPVPVPAAAKDKTSEAPKGVVPPVDGEYFTLKRCYQMRPSTIRKLSEIKARHSNVNAYLSTILDEAILHYYEHIVSPGSNGKQNI